MSAASNSIEGKPNTVVIFDFPSTVVSYWSHKKQPAAQAIHPLHLRTIASVITALLLSITNTLWQWRGKNRSTVDNIIKTRRFIPSIKFLSFWLKLPRKSVVCAIVSPASVACYYRSFPFKRQGLSFAFICLSFSIGIICIVLYGFGHYYQDSTRGNIDAY